jgi:exonuclease III
VQAASTRIVSWNIRAGGGRRAASIAAQIAAWDADIVALSEFRATPPSRALAERLADDGLEWQRTTAAPSVPGVNALLVASRWPLRPLRLRMAPPEPARWLLARVEAPPEQGGPFALGAMHAPNFVTGRKWPYLDALLAFARRWRGPALLAGDTNTGRIGLDEQSPVFDRRHHEWMEAMHRRWPDVFRHLHGDEARAYTWYSPNAGNGFRLDQAFVSRSLLPRVVSARYEWGRLEGEPRREALSDHAALILELRG